MGASEYDGDPDRLPEVQESLLEQSSEDAEGRSLMTVTMVTLIDTDSVLYTVHTGDPLMGDFDHNGREVWRKEVPFGYGDRFRPGGPAFVEAAREQEKVAESYALMPYEPRRTPDEQAEDEGQKWAAEGDAARHPKERW
jgi:hypothetical protein